MQSALKRLMDMAGALVGLVALFPLLGLLWLAVVAESGLPGFFRQQRAGRRGRHFTLLKFRSMAVRLGTEHGSFDAGCAARVTRVGAFLRKTKLDELPQLWNVFKGDMSLVGPRPEVRKWVEAYPERWARVLTPRGVGRGQQSGRAAARTRDGGWLVVLLVRVQALL